MGTLIEIITYYLLDYWHLTYSTSIERGLAEYGNAEITHNVEFSLHPIFEQQQITLESAPTNISANLIAKKMDLSSDFLLKSNTLLDSNNILKNACVIAESADSIILAFLVDKTKKKTTLQIVRQSKLPFAMFECKRVGVEEGNKKGPQTIEKAKQGAYVAKMTSSLQKIRTDNGKRYGLLFENGVITTKPYFELLNEIIYTRETVPANFILSIGVVSNHGNWFTNEDQNKELKVLAQSYDWLLFLTDDGLAQFVTDLLLKPAKEYKCVKEAFLNSYSAEKKLNRFTKVKMDIDAHKALIHYFQVNSDQIATWFNIISPQDGTLQRLQENLNILTQKTNH